MGSSYNGDIPAGATVHWYVRSTDNGQVLSEGQLTTDEISSTLTITKRDFTCEDFSSDDKYHKLFVSIDSPSFTLVNVSKLHGSSCKTMPPLPEHD